MNDSFILKSTMSPVLPFKPSKGPTKSKGVTKLSLKKFLRRSQILDNISSRTVNNSLILIDDSSTETESVISNSSNSVTNNNATIITITDSDKSVIDESVLETSITKKSNECPSNDQDIKNCYLSNSKFVSIAKWISKINNENEINMSSKLNDIRNESKLQIDSTVTEFNAGSHVINSKSYSFNKSSKTNVQETSSKIFSTCKDSRFPSADKEVDSLSRSIKNLHINNNLEVKANECHSEHKLEKKFQEPDEDIIEGSDDSFTQQKGLFNSTRRDLSKSEPRKTKKNRSVIKTPRTEIKIKPPLPSFHKNPYMHGDEDVSNNAIIKPMWIHRLNLLCDSDSSSINSNDNSPNINLLQSSNKNIPISKYDNRILLSNNKDDDDFHNTNKKLNKESAIERVRTRLSFSDNDEDEQNTARLSREFDDLINKIKENSKDISEPLTKPSSYRDSEHDSFSNLSDNDETLEERIRKKIGIHKTLVSTQPTNKLKEKDNVYNNETASKNNETDFNLDIKKIDVPKKKGSRCKKKSNKCEPVPLKNHSENKTQKSFLASLSANVKISDCDPSARIFRNNFQTYKTQLTTKLFTLFNEKVFSNAIPSDTPLEWNDRLRGTAGYCYCKKIIRRTGIVERSVRIVLSTKVLDTADRLRDTLIHELCHAATWIVNKVSNGHGEYWKEWTVKARTIFPELPPIKRCHEYSINTKYTYKCINCGYSIGRHSKSLNIERKRCGYCYGKFELLLNKTSKNGETKSVPVTPKKEVSGFALFVKENYAVVKTPQMNHGQVMKLLGQKFSEMKATN